MVDYNRVVPDGDPPGWPCPLYPNPKSSLKCKIARECLAQIDAIIALIQSTEASNDANHPAPPTSQPDPPVPPPTTSESPTLPPPCTPNAPALAPAPIRTPLALPSYTIPSVPTWQHEHLCLYRWMSVTGLGEWGDGTDKELDNAAAAMQGNGDKARMYLGGTRRTLMALLKDLNEVLYEMRAALNGELTLDHEDWLHYEPFGLSNLKVESRAALVHGKILDLWGTTAMLDGFTAGLEPEIRNGEGAGYQAESVEELRERRQREKEERKVKWERYHAVMAEEEGSEEEDDDDDDDEEEEEEVVDAINELSVPERQKKAEEAKAKAAAEEEDRWKPGIEELDHETYEAIREEEARKRAAVEERYIRKYDTQLQFWNEGRYAMVDMTETIPQLRRRDIAVMELDEEGNEIGIFQGAIDDNKTLRGRRFWRKGTESLVSCGTSKRNRISVMVRVPVSGCWRKQSREPEEVERLLEGMRWENIHEELGC